MLPEGMAARLVELLLHGLLDDVMMPQLVSFENKPKCLAISGMFNGRGFPGSHILVMLHVSNDFSVALEMEHGYQIANPFRM